MLKAMLTTNKLNKQENLQCKALLVSCCILYRFRPKSFSFIFNEVLKNLLLLKFFKIIFQTKIRQNLNELKFMSMEQNIICYTNKTSDF